MRATGEILEEFMKDLTQGSIERHIFAMATPACIAMLSQIAYQLIDLYFVTQIGVAATAGVNAAGNIAFIVAALTQMLGVGVVALVAQAVGAGNRAEVNQTLNQSIGLSAILAVLVIILAYMFTRTYLRAITDDEFTLEAGVTFIYWSAPGYVMSLLTAALSSALRGTGMVKPAVVLYLLTVFINAILAPILIAGWGTGLALGVKGAGLATTVATAAGFFFLLAYFHRAQSYIAIEWRSMLPRRSQWGRILKVGAPAGGDHLLFFFTWRRCITQFEILERRFKQDLASAHAFCRHFYYPRYVFVCRRRLSRPKILAQGRSRE